VLPVHVFLYLFFFLFFPQRPRTVFRPPGPSGPHRFLYFFFFTLVKKKNTDQKNAKNASPLLVFSGFFLSFFFFIFSLKNKKKTHKRPAFSLEKRRRETVYLIFTTNILAAMNSLVLVFKGVTKCLSKQHYCL